MVNTVVYPINQKEPHIGMKTKLLAAVSSKQKTAKEIGEEIGMNYSSTIQGLNYLALLGEIERMNKKGKYTYKKKH